MTTPPMNWTISYLLLKSTVSPSILLIAIFEFGNVKKLSYLLLLDAAR